MMNMKDSGIEWIGEIPKDWEVIRLKIICDLENGFSFKSCDYIEESNTLCCRMSNIRPNGVFDISYSKIYLPDSYVSKYKSYLLKDKDIIIAMTDMASAPKILGVPTEVKTDGYNLLLNQRVGKLIIKNNSINTLFLKYSMSSESSKYYFTLLSDKNIQINLSKENLLNMFITYPSLEEQELIANYLDSKVSEIDNIISKTKETIEEYRKYKQSVITEVVTKGLNPNVEMKDSGIEWIGEIPKDWKVVKLKNIGTCFGGVTYSPENITDEINGRLVLRSSNVQDGKLSFDDNVYINLDIHEKYIVKKGDILVCSRNGSRNLIGKNAIIENDYDYTFGAFMTIVRTKNYNYVYYFLNSDIFKSQSSLYLTSTINQLTLGVFNNFKLCLPSEEEQKQIVTYLDKKCGEIDKLISKKQNLITELEEYKKSLIYECVTGKKEVSVSYAY